MKWIIIALFLLIIPAVTAFTIQGCNITQISVTTVSDFKSNEENINCYLNREEGLDLWYLRTFVGSRHTQMISGNYSVELLMDRGRLEGLSPEPKYPRVQVNCPQAVINSCLEQGKDPRDWRFITQTQECEVRALRATAVPSVSAFNIMRSVLTSIATLQGDHDFGSRDLYATLESSARLLFVGHYAIATFFDTFIGVYR
jgi:hypothetical protein